jgi:hypothetical protein
VKVNFEIHNKTIRIVLQIQQETRISINQSINQSILESVGGKMSSLHEAAEQGQLDECRRLVEKEGKNANEENRVNICMISSICIN